MNNNYDTGPEPGPPTPTCHCGHVYSYRPKQNMYCDALGIFEIILEKCPNENGIYHQNIYIKILKDGKGVKIVEE